MDARTASDHAYGSVPSLDNGDGDAPPRRRCVAAVSLGLACISACVPLANKAVLRHGAKKAALTMTACQLFSVALICGLIHAVIACKNGAPLRLSEVRRKARNIGPLGVAFGLKLGATNVGLALVSVEMHVLLAATDIVRTALFARLINGERVRNVTGGLALVGCFAGACLVSTDSYDAGRHVAFYAVALNLVGPVIQGIVVTLLRRSATREVARQNTSYVEFTFVKLAFSTATAGVLALLIEGVADARSSARPRIAMSRTIRAVVANAGRCVLHYASSQNRWDLVRILVDLEEFEFRAVNVVAYRLLSVGGTH